MKKSAENVKSKTPSDSYVVSRKLVMPDQINSLGGLFGGQVMAWIDKVGAMVAQRHAAGPVVTASIDHIVFMAPVRLGNHVILEGVLTYVGRTSMEIAVGVWAENPFDGTRVQTTQAYLTFVALDKNGKPTSVPALRTENEVQKRLYKQAQMRVEERMAARKDFKAEMGQYPTLDEILKS